MQGQRCGGRALRADQPRLRGQRLRVGGVDADALSRKRVTVDRVAGQRMTEPIALAGLVDDQQVVLDGVAERRVEAGVVKVGDPREEPVGDRTTGRGGDPEQRQRLRRQLLRARQQHVPQSRRQLLRAGAGLQRGEDLLDQKRVAFRPLVEHIEHGPRRAVIENRLELTGDLLPGEPL